MNYAIGDVQGCFNVLEKLLEHIQFDLNEDRLWFVGDLVNRGPQSLSTLRFIKNLGDRHPVVLGNHDLHLLALSHQAHPGWKEDTLEAILTAPDRDELMAWLSQRPLLYHDPLSGFTMVHAGLAPEWDLLTAKRLAKEVEAVISGDTAAEFFYHMYGNQPARWNEQLQGWDRLRCITNYLTRLRFCHLDGRMELNSKGTLDSYSPELLIPWFKVKPRANENVKILFGHWAALGGVTDVPNTYALDTGCVWGYKLTAMRLEDGKRFSVEA
ncbi:MAG: apaH [Gammaproteobacteria bacterium]|jgi:bis(5'-nucleosyl)-tetraphosphatase (symmetrical)|nr:apaH [Gammaproteobacteria bacterium]